MQTCLVPAQPLCLLSTWCCQTPPAVSMGAYCRKTAQKALHICISELGACTANDCKGRKGEDKGFASRLLLFAVALSAILAQCTGTLQTHSSTLKILFSFSGFISLFYTVVHATGEQEGDSVRHKAGRNPQMPSVNSATERKKDAAN